MIPYRIQEADLSIPDTWSDQSINIFKVPATEISREASFVISRDASRGETPFKDYVTRQLDEAKKQLPEYSFLSREDFELRGHAASSIRYRWNSNGCDLVLCQVFIEREPAVVILTLTTTPEDAANHAAVWKEVIRAYRPISAADASHQAGARK
jgi:hypothetical protein